MTQYQATFFISTGRCATQWLADSLNSYYSDYSLVRHEPFHVEYNPCKYFDSFHCGDEIVLSAELENHLEYIEKTLQAKNYIEVGWPVYGVLPKFLSKLGPRVKLVHLFRHPIRVAASLATHNIYRGGNWTDAMSITPFACGTTQQYLQGSWESMSEFEKCLFMWTEVNSYALRLKNQYKSIPWLSISYEDIFDESDYTSLRNLIKFLGLPERRDFIQSRDFTTDRWKRKADEKINYHLINEYPKALQTMDLLGYKLNGEIVSEAKKRYDSSYRRVTQRLLKIFSLK